MLITCSRAIINYSVIKNFHKKTALEYFQLRKRNMLPKLLHGLARSDE